MRIDVVVKEWERACCGGPFRIGDRVTWKILATGPDTGPNGEPSRFREEHHDQVPEDVPHGEVSGVVRAITGITYPKVPIAGDPRGFTLDTDHPQAQPLEYVDTETGVGFTEYLVAVEVADDCPLPPFRHREEMIPALTHALLSGPRGRRLLLEYALESERLTAAADDGSFGAAVFMASYHLDPGKGSSVVMFGPGATEAEQTVITADEVAERLEHVALEPVTAALLRTALARSVSAARYWQEPDGADALSATVIMRNGLVRVAEHIAASGHAGWWHDPVDEHSQWSTLWDGAPPRPPLDERRELLRAKRSALMDEERRAARERPIDPTSNWSGTWWSRPFLGTPSSTRALPDGGPAGLWFVEDGFGWEQGETIRLGFPEGLRVFEIDTAEAWAKLCREFPIEVTAGKRHDWYRTTGRTGRWVMPDWARVAEHYDAVHLQVTAYLAAAGTSIPVGDDTATVLAGWDPDQTYWFTPGLHYLGTPVQWVLEERGEDNVWVRQDGGAVDGG